MSISKLLRKWMLLIVVLAIGIVLTLVLLATDTALSVWQRLDELSPIASTLYGIALLLIAVVSAVLAISFLRPRKQQEPEQELDREQIDTQLAQARAQGVNTSTVEKELRVSDQRADQGHLYIALFGEISTGKSSLINALLPGAQVKTGVIGGVTDRVQHFEWRENDATPITLTDLPGVEQSEDDQLGRLASREALRAHLILYVVDSDLNRRQHRHLDHLSQFGKPIIVVLNKADQYSEQNLEKIRTRLLENLDAVNVLDLVSVSAGGSETVVVVDSDGNEQTQTRNRTPEIAALTRRVTKLFDSEQAALKEQHQTSSLKLAKVQLDQAQQAYRKEASDALIKKYSRRAMIGALAAITPGSDLVIQGALASKLLADLANLYDRSLRDVDVDRFLQLAGSRLRNATSITLAVGGNALKAFPGIGTISGALVHAVAYGMIFESLGKAVARALETEQEWQSGQTANQFEEYLLGHLETRSKDFAKMALQLNRDRDTQR